MCLCMSLCVVDIHFVMLPKPMLGVCQCCAWSVNSFSRLAVFTLANGATTFYRGGSSESCKTIDISSVGVTEPGHFAHRGPPRPPDDDYPPIYPSVCLRQRGVSTSSPVSGSRWLQAADWRLPPPRRGTTQPNIQFGRSAPASTLRRIMFMLQISLI